MGQPGNWWAGLFFGNNRSAKTRWSTNVRWDNSNNGSTLNLSGSLSIEPSDRMRLSFSPRYRRVTNGLQYVTTLDRATDRTFGQRFIFSTVEQSTLSARLGINYSFSPNLNLDFSAEPFTSSGRFSDFSELPEARSFDLRRFGTDGTTITENVAEDGTRSFGVTDGEESFTLSDRDFNTISFRSNLVLRWEFKPGSTLFVTWRQDRSNFERTGDFVTPGSLFDSITAPGSNTLSVKFSYWLQMR